MLYFALWPRRERNEREQPHSLTHRSFRRPKTALSAIWAKAFGRVRYLMYELFPPTTFWPSTTSRSAAPASAASPPPSPPPRPRARPGEPWAPGTRPPPRGVSARALIMNFAILVSLPTEQIRGHHPWGKHVQNHVVDLEHGELGLQGLVELGDGAFGGAVRRNRGVALPLVPAPSMLNTCPVLPGSCERIRLMASFMQNIRPKVFVSTISCRSSDPVSIKGLNWYAFVPALLTQMSTCPKNSLAYSKVHNVLCLAHVARHATHPVPALTT